MHTSVDHLSSTFEYYHENWTIFGLAHTPVGDNFCWSNVWCAWFTDQSKEQIPHSYFRYVKFYVKFLYIWFCEIHFIASHISQNLKLITEEEEELSNLLNSSFFLWWKVKGAHLGLQVLHVNLCPEGILA